MNVYIYFLEIDKKTKQEAESQENMLPKIIPYGTKVMKFDTYNVCSICFGHKTIFVQHDSITSICIVSFDLYVSIDTQSQEIIRMDWTQPI